MMTEKRVRELMVANLKAGARKLNREKKWADLAKICRELDRIWKDDRAAQAFYTELEQEADQS